MSEKMSNKRAGQRLENVSLHSRRRVRKLHRVAGEADLRGRGELGEAVQLVEAVKISARVLQKGLDQPFEMAGGDQGDGVGSAFLETEILALLGLPVRHPHDAIDDEMADLMGDDVEIECEWRQHAVRLVIGADLHEAVADLGIVQLGMEDDLEPAVVPRNAIRSARRDSVPRCRGDKAGGRVDMGLLNSGEVQGYVIEMAIGARRQAGGSARARAALSM